MTPEELLAQTAANPIDLWPTLISWGPPAAILGFILWLLYTSKLYTKAEMARVIAMYEQRIAEWQKRCDEEVARGEEWKDHALKSTDAVAGLSDGLRPLKALPAPKHSGAHLKDSSSEPKK